MNKQKQIAYLSFKRNFVGVFLRNKRLGESLPLKVAYKNKNQMIAQRVLIIPSYSSSN